MSRANKNRQITPLTIRFLVWWFCFRRRQTMGINQKAQPWKMSANKKIT